MRWIWPRLRSMWEVIYSPETLFSRKLDGASCLVPFAVLSSLSIILSIIQSPIHLDWMRAQLSMAGADQARVASSVDLMQRSTRAGVVIIPILLMVRWLAHALLIWLTAQLFLVYLSFSQTLTVVAYSYVPVILRDATLCLILCLRDTDVLMQAEGLNVAIGLNLIFHRIPAPWWALAANVNPFEVWFVAILVVGIGALARESRRKTLAVVLPVWFFITILQFGLVALGYELKNQFLRS